MLKLKFHNLKFQSVDRSLCRLGELLSQDTLFTLSKVVASFFYGKLSGVWYCGFLYRHGITALYHRPFVISINLLKSLQVFPRKTCELSSWKVIDPCLKTSVNTWFLHDWSTTVRLITIKNPIKILVSPWISLDDPLIDLHASKYVDQNTKKQPLWLQHSGIFL